MCFEVKEVKKEVLSMGEAATAMSLEGVLIDFPKIGESISRLEEGLAEVIEKECGGSFEEWFDKLNTLFPPELRESTLDLSQSLKDFYPVVDAEIFMRLEKRMK